MIKDSIEKLRRRTGVLPHSFLLLPSQLRKMKNKSVLITGGGQGLGRGFALHLAVVHGMNITIADQNSSGAMVADEINRTSAAAKRALFVQCDVLDYLQQLDLFQQHVAHWGTLDLVILNAGILWVEKIVDIASDPHPPPPSNHPTK